MKKETITTKTSNPLNTLQYIFSVVIAIIFGIGVFSTKYQELFPVILTFALIQLLITMLRFRILNLVIELFVLIFIILAWVPIIGWPFRLIGLIVVLIEMSVFKNITIQKKIQTIYFNNSKSKKKKKTKTTFTDAEFKEK